MVSLGRKLKFTKTCEKRLYNHTWVVVCKKGLQKIANIKKWQLFENGQNWPLRKGYSPRKMVSFGRKLKFTKTCEKRLYNMFLWILIFDPNWPFCVGYSLCIVANFGHFRKAVIFWILAIFWSHFSHTTTLVWRWSPRVVVCEKWLQKIANIKKMTAFRKWPKLATMQRL